MIQRVFVVIGISLVILTGAPAEAQRQSDQPVAFVGAKIYPAVGQPIEDGVMIIRKGKILAIGPGKDVRIPRGALRYDVKGRSIIPGLVDTHSHIGIYPRPAVEANQDGNEMTGPVQSGLRAIDAIYPLDPGIKMAVAGGVTTANIMPGSGNVIGGETLYVKLRGNTIDEMRIVDPKILGGLKMANGENPKGYGRRTPRRAPGTRMKVASLQREQFAKAREYQRKWATYRTARRQGREAEPPDRDVNLDSLVQVLDRKRTVHFHSHRADDLLTALRIAKEFDFEIVLQHVTEGYLVADELARRKIPVSLTLVDSPGGKMETANLIAENAGVLEKAGVKVAINTDDYITESRFFLRTGAIGVRGGMTEAGALKAITINPAEMMHLDHRIGSLEPGKDADFVVLSGPPFSVYTHVLATYIDGRQEFSRKKKENWVYQTGGFGLADQEVLSEPAKPVEPQPVVTAPPLEEKNPKNAGVTVIHAARIHTVAQGTIEDGAILIENGKINQVASRNQVNVPGGARIITAAVATPGLIDAHSVVGISGKFNLPADQDQDEISDPVQPDLRVLDSFNPHEPLLEFFRQNGVTVIHATPGRANIIAGQTGIFRTKGTSVERMALRFPAGILVNLGEVPKAAYPGKKPGTRMGSANLIRNAFAKARDYARKKKGSNDPAKQPATNLKWEALSLALNRKIPVIFSAHRADDILTSLRIAKEFKLNPILDLATEGYIVADQIAEAKAPVIVHPTLQRVRTLETFNTYMGNAAHLSNKGIQMVQGTAFEGYVPKTRIIRYEAAMSMVNGLGFDKALSSITLDAARLLGIDDRYGSIEPGKVADIVLYDGDPFEHATHVKYTLMDGEVVFSRADYLKMPFARRALPLLGGDVGCCMGIW